MLEQPVKNLFRRQVLVSVERDGRVGGAESFADSSTNIISLVK
jgi:hypothetical protein